MFINTDRRYLFKHTMHSIGFHPEFNILSKICLYARVCWLDVSALGNSR